MKTFASNVVYLDMNECLYRKQHDPCFLTLRDEKIMETNSTTLLLEFPNICERSAKIMRFLQISCQVWT